MTHEANIFHKRNQRACVRTSRGIPISLWRKCVHFVTAFAIWRLWKFFSNDSGAYWRFWLLSIIKLHFPSDAREAVLLLSQPESEWNGCWQFHRVRKSSCGTRVMPCTQRSCAVLPGGFVWCSAGTGEDAQETRFPPYMSPWWELACWKTNIFLSSPWTGSSVKGPLLWSLCLLTSRFLRNDLTLWSPISWGLMTYARDLVLQGWDSRHICSVTCWR